MCEGSSRPNGAVVAAVVVYMQHVEVVVDRWRTEEPRSGTEVLLPMAAGEGGNTVRALFFYVKEIPIYLSLRTDGMSCDTLTAVYIRIA